MTSDDFRLATNPVTDMPKTLFLVRHGKAEGQASEAVLTPDGHDQAEVLAEMLSMFGVERIVSSPFMRARQTILPLAQRLSIKIETDERLIEAALSTIDYPDWLERLQMTFIDMELYYEGGESSRLATSRGIAALNDILQAGPRTTVVVTHGRLLTLILKSFDSRFGFDQWRSLTAPDMFRLVIVEGDEPRVDHIWKQGT